MLNNVSCCWNRVYENVQCLLVFVHSVNNNALTDCINACCLRICKKGHNIGLA